MEFCQKQTTGIGFEEEFDAIKITEEKMVWLALSERDEDVDTGEGVLMVKDFVVIFPENLYELPPKRRSTLRLKYEQGHHNIYTSLSYGT